MHELQGPWLVLSSLTSQPLSQYFCSPFRRTAPGYNYNKLLGSGSKEVTGWVWGGTVLLNKTWKNLSTLSFSHWPAKQEALTWVIPERTDGKSTFLNTQAGGTALLFRHNILYPIWFHFLLLYCVLLRPLCKMLMSTIHFHPKACVFFAPTFFPFSKKVNMVKWCEIFVFTHSVTDIPCLLPFFF